MQSQIELMKDPSRFSRLVINLLGQEHPDYQAIDDDRGDGGNDGYVPSEKRIFARHCFKKLPKRDLDSEILKKLKSDLDKAVKLKESGDYEVENWTYITNYAVSNDVVKQMRALGQAAGIAAIHKGAGYVASLALKHKHVLSEFPELEQLNLLDEMHTGFTSLAEKLPQTPNAQSKLVGDINEVLRTLLIHFTLYGDIEVNPYLTAINRQMALARLLIEAQLSPVARLFGDASELHIDLEELSKELRPASTNYLSLDGGSSYRQRMEHLQNARRLVKKLVQDIGKYVTVQGLDDTAADLLHRLLRWFDSIDPNQNVDDFHNQSEENATRLLRIYTYYFQAGDEVTSAKYAQLAKDIFELGQDGRSGGGEVLNVELPKLRQRVEELSQKKDPVEQAV